MYSIYVLYKLGEMCHNKYESKTEEPFLTDTRTSPDRPMPVIKICGNPNTYERMQHDMDLNAGRIITGEATIEQVGEEAFQEMLKVLSGKMTKNEALGYFGSMDIFCLGPVI